MSTDRPHPPNCPGPAAHTTRYGHPSCAAHVKGHTKDPADTSKGHRTRLPGEPCLQPQAAGQNVCRYHGAASSQAKKAAKTRMVLADAARAVELFAGRRDVEPGAALLELVQWTAGEVDYWRQEVRLLERADLTWGKTRVKDGGDDRGVTSEAKPNIAYVMLTQASDRLAAYCVAALKAGIAERAIRMAEAEGSLVADVIRSILGDLNLSPAQQELVGTVVPARLRAITGGAA